MKPTAYIETTIVSYLTSRLSRDLIIAAHQQLTQEWWGDRRQEFDLYVSELVVQEAGAGDPSEAQKRLDALEDIPQLELSENCRSLARELLDRHAVPAEAVEDALHIAVSAVHGMDYLLTWNCAHIANAQMREAIEGVCRASGYEPPIICTPEELMGDKA
ncbi:MAG: type II toxin-antitoxin system VapC family toxin [bacterium]